jgi:hypothetical protein
MLSIAVGARRERRLRQCLVDRVAGDRQSNGAVDRHDEQARQCRHCVVDPGCDAENDCVDCIHHGGSAVRPQSPDFSA